MCGVFDEIRCVVNDRLEIVDNREMWVVGDMGCFGFVLCEF